MSYLDRHIAYNIKSHYYC